MATGLILNHGRTQTTNSYRRNRQKRRRNHSRGQLSEPPNGPSTDDALCGGEEFARLFHDKGVNKIVTIEASGIAPAILLGYIMHLPVVFVKKKAPKTIDESWKSWVWSFTRGDETTICVDKNLLTDKDRIVFIDDFLADGHASGGIIHLCRQSGAQIVGMGFLVEKGFASGGQFLRDHNITYYALATIKQINDDNTMVIE